MGLKEQLIEATRPPERVVEVGGVPVLMVGMGLGAKMALAEMDGMDGTFYCLEQMIRDPATRARLFDDADESLRAMDDKHLDTLAGVARELLGLDEQAKNSEATPLSAISAG